VLEKHEQNDNVDGIALTEQSIAPTLSSETQPPVLSMAKRHLHNFQQQKLNTLAAKASRYINNIKTRLSFIIKPTNHL
jgi:hypothetical protein